MTAPAFLNVGLGEMVVLGVVALLIFGERLPDAMRTLGRTYAKFRHALHEAARPVREEMNRIDREARNPAARPTTAPRPTEEPPPPPPPPTMARPTEEPPPV